MSENYRNDEGVASVFSCFTCVPAGRRSLFSVPFLILLASLVTVTASAETATRVARVTKEIPLNSGLVIPVGAEIEVQYDAGSVWVPRWTYETPFVLKSSAELLEQATFMPPVNGTINKLTPLYQRMSLDQSLGYLATKVEPNTTGNVLEAGTSVKIVERVGQYYRLQAPTPIDIQLVPVDSVTVTPEDLATGEAATDLPPPQSVGNDQTPQSGWLYGKLKVPYTLEGKNLSAGSYVQIGYDAGQSWILFGGLSPGTGPRISKAAIEVVPAKNFFGSPLIGKIKVGGPVFQGEPNLRDDPTTLDQKAGLGLSFMNQNAQSGEIVSIDRQEGDDYIIQFQRKGIIRNRYRAPVSNVEIIAGNPDAGTPVVIEAVPQSTNPKAAGYVAPPPRPEEDHTGETIGTILELFVAISVVVGIIGAAYRSSVNASNTSASEAEYGVPHTNSKKTADGFQVIFCRSSPSFHAVTHYYQNLQHTGGGIAAIGFILFMILMIFVLLLWYGIESFFKTTIVVDRETVKIDGKPMSRADFGNFNIDHTLTGGKVTYAVLGYRYGRRSFAFGGVWEHGQAMEVANALNADLRRTPLGYDDNRASPENLRTARPSDF